MPVPESSEDWALGRDARIKQLPGPPQEVLERRARAEQLRQHQMGKADVSCSFPFPLRLFSDVSFTRLLMSLYLPACVWVQYTFLAMVIGGMLFMALLVLGITGGSVWFLALRENAPWSVRSPPLPLPSFFFAFRSLVVRAACGGPETEPDLCVLFCAGQIAR